MDNDIHLISSGPLLVSIASFLVALASLYVSKKLSKAGILNTIIQIAHQKAKECNDIMKEFQTSRANNVYAIGMDIVKEFPFYAMSEVNTSYEMLCRAIRHHKKMGVSLDSRFILDQFWLHLSLDIRNYCRESIPESLDGRYEEEYYDLVRKIQQVFGNQFYKN